jgi:hypothetical protein
MCAFSLGHTGFNDTMLTTDLRVDGMIILKWISKMYILDWIHLSRDKCKWEESSVKDKKCVDYFCHY